MEDKGSGGQGVGWGDKESIMDTVRGQDIVRDEAQWE